MVHYVLLHIIQMTAEDGSNGAWRGDIEGRCSTFITSLFCLPFDKRLGGPGNM